MTDTNEQLIKDCISGSESAWETLVDKHKGLVYYWTRRYRLSQEDADDAFQEVCYQMVQELHKLRDYNRLASWVGSIAKSVCYQHLGRERCRAKKVEDYAYSPSFRSIESPHIDGMVRRAEYSIIHQALAELPDNRRELLKALFFEEPTPQYKEIAPRLGLAEGSIGFLRKRWTEKLGQRIREILSGKQLTASFE